MGFMPHAHWSADRSVRHPVTTSAPPSVYWLEEKVLALRNAIREEIILKVIGCGKDLSELWDGYGVTLPAFADMRTALHRLHQLRGVDDDINPDLLSRIVGKRVSESGLEIDVEEVEYIVATGHRHLSRVSKTRGRLRDRQLEQAFFETDNGRQWAAATLGFAWGLLGLRAIVDDVDAFSPEDVHFCLFLMQYGPRDSYAFARGFELDQKAEENLQDELEFMLDTSEMSAELAELEHMEFEEGERMLRELEKHG